MLPLLADAIPAPLAPEVLKLNRLLDRQTSDAPPSFWYSCTTPKKVVDGPSTTFEQWRAAPSRSRPRTFGRDLIFCSVMM